MAKKDKNTIVDINNDGFFEKVKELQTLQKTIKDTKKISDNLTEDLKDISKEKWSNLYEEKNENPETIIVSQTNDDGDNAQVMLVPSDRYISIKEDRAIELKETYGDDIVETETVLSFNNDMISKYGQLLIDLILESDLIEDEDKENIIQSNTTYSISKGTINKLPEYGNINEILENIKPIFSIKNVEIVKG